MAQSGFDTYIADNQFRKRNPLFKESETYETEQEKRRLKRSKGKPRLFTSSDFHYDEVTQTCRCPAGNEMWRSDINVKRPAAIAMYAKATDTNRAASAV
nr:hypothetical protein [Pseudoalteromonas ulvae]